jgi:hypothetical protein
MRTPQLIDVTPMDAPSDALSAEATVTVTAFYTVAAAAATHGAFCLTRRAIFSWPFGECRLSAAFQLSAVGMSSVGPSPTSSYRLEKFMLDTAAFVDLPESFPQDSSQCRHVKIASASRWRSRACGETSRRGLRNPGPGDCSAFLLPKVSTEPLASSHDILTCTDHTGSAEKPRHGDALGRGRECLFEKWR